MTIAPTLAKQFLKNPFLQNKKINYKELTDGPEKTLADPTLYNPPRTYRLNNNKVYVDDKLILIKDNTWRFSND